VLRERGWMHRGQGMEVTFGQGVNPTAARPLGSSLNIPSPSSAPSQLEPGHPKAEPNQKLEGLGAFKAPGLLPETRTGSVEGCKAGQTEMHRPVTTGNNGMCVDRANEQ